MKLIMAILNRRDAENALDSLVQRDFRATSLASTGGYLRRRNTTLLVGVQDEVVDEAIDIIRDAASEPTGPEQGKGVAFVLEVEDFEQL